MGMKQVFGKGLLSFPLLFFLFSCDGRTPVDSIPDSVFDRAEVLLPSGELDYKPSGGESQIYVFGDTLLLVCEKLSEAGRLFTVLNLKTGEDLTPDSLFLYGAEDGKLMPSIVYRHRDTLLISDVVKRDIYLISVDDLLAGRKCPPLASDIKWSANKILPYRGRLLFLNSECFPEVSEEYHKDGPRFAYTDSSYNYEAPQSMYSTLSVVTGEYDINWSKGRIIFGDDDVNRIEVYDTDLKLLRILMGRNRFMPEYACVQNRDGYIFAYTGEICQAYRAVVSTDEFAYLLYMDSVWIEDEDRDSFCSYVLKMDWNGNIVTSYRIGAYVKSLSVSENDSCLYAFCLDEHGYRILKYDLQ